jgi:hypothetical protein
VPRRARGYSFEYELVKISRLGATLQYTERIYYPGADDFEMFKEGDEIQTMQYRIEDIDKAHEHWQAANSRLNARLYIERERLKKAQTSSVVVDESIAHSMDDIEDFFQKHGRGSHLLEYDFTPDTPQPVNYEKSNGQLSIFQCWTHKYTKHSVKRYATQSGKAVDSGRLSNYLKRIKKSDYPLAYARAQKILSLNDSVVDHSDALAIPIVMDRKDLLKQQVKAVLFTIEAGVAAIALQGVYAKRFFQHLDPLHKPPHNLMFMRIVRLLELAFFKEYRRLIDDNVLWLGRGFASTNSDFYKNPERRESYGCIVATMAAIRYDFKGGQKLFVSKQTLNEGVSNLLSCSKGVLSQLETVNSFKLFDGAHTGKAIGEWLAKEPRRRGCCPAT